MYIHEKNNDSNCFRKNAVYSKSIRMKKYSVLRNWIVQGKCLECPNDRSGGRNYTKMTQSIKNIT